MNRKITIRIVLIITAFLILSSSLFAPIYPDAFKLSSREEFLLRVIMLIVTIVVTAPIWIPMVIIAVVVDKKEKKEEKEEKEKDYFFIIFIYNYIIVLTCLLKTISMLQDCTVTTGSHK